MIRFLTILLLSVGLAHSAPPPYTRTYETDAEISNLVVHGISQTMASFNTNIIQVETWGNDAMAASSVAYPFRTLEAAKAAVTGPRNCIYVGPGDFNYTTSAGGLGYLQLPKNCNLIGSGKRLTRLIGTGRNLAFKAAFSPGDNSYVSRLTIMSTNIDFLNTPVGPLTQDTASTNVVYEDVEVLGTTDCLLVDSASVSSATFYNCKLTSIWDTIVINGNAANNFEFFNCDVRAGFAYGTINVGGQVHGVSGSAGRVGLYGGIVAAENGFGETVAIDGRNGPTAVDIYGTTLVGAATNGLVCAVTNFLSVITIQNSWPTNVVAGPNVFVHNGSGGVGSSKLLGGLTLGTTNVTLGHSSNSFSESLVVFDTSVGGLKTNYLPDIGGKLLATITVRTNPTVGQTLTIGTSTTRWTNDTPDPYGPWTLIGVDAAESASNLSDVLSGTAQWLLFVESTALTPQPTNLLVTLLPTAGYPTVTFAGSWGSVSRGTQSVALAEGRLIRVKDGGGNASVNTIRIHPTRDQKIDGVGTYVMSTNYQAITLQAVGTNWSIIGRYP